MRSFAKFIFAATSLLCSAAADAGEALNPHQVVVDDKMIIVPAQPGSTVQPFGSGALVKTPGEPTISVQPLGSGVIVKQPGKSDVVCSPFGSRTLCR